MYVVKAGALAAAFVAAGIVGLPNDFNLDDGVINKLEAKAAIDHPSLDRDAHRSIAIIEAAKDFAADLDRRNKEIAAKEEADRKAAEEAKATEAAASTPATEVPAPVAEPVTPVATVPESTPPAPVPNTATPESTPAPSTTPPDAA